MPTHESDIVMVPTTTLVEGKEMLAVLSAIIYAGFQAGGSDMSTDYCIRRAKEIVRKVVEE